jgi:hypothetical protein
MPKTHKKRERSEDLTPSKPAACNVPPDGAPSVADNGHSHPKSLSKAERRKAKKLRKQLERGECDVIPASIPAPIAACVVSAPGAKLAFEIQTRSIDKKQKLDFIQVEVRRADVWRCMARMLVSLNISENSRVPALVVREMRRNGLGSREK